jgi:hypothetical protein
MELILSIAGGAIIIMLGIIGYFIARNDKRQEKTNDQLSKAIDRLSTTISGLNAVVMVFEEKHDNLAKDYYKHKEKYHEK